MPMNKIEEMRQFLDLSKKLFAEEKVFPLTESNVLDVYKRLVNNEDVPQEELEDVKKRFDELLTYNY